MDIKYLLPALGAALITIVALTAYDEESSITSIDSLSNKTRARQTANSVRYNGEVLSLKTVNDVDGRSRQVAYKEKGETTTIYFFNKDNTINEIVEIEGNVNSPTLKRSTEFYYKEDGTQDHRVIEEHLKNTETNTYKENYIGNGEYASLAAK
ncbi:MAG: hypothetical protein ACK5IQ_04630 [Bacteroidales bacterium]